MEICSSHRYFETEELGEAAVSKGEKLNVYNMLLTFFKELIAK